MCASSSTHHAAKLGPHWEADARLPQSGTLAPKHTFDLPPCDYFLQPQSLKPLPSLPDVASSSRNSPYPTIPTSRPRKLVKPLSKSRPFTKRRHSTRSSPKTPVLGFQQPRLPERSRSLPLPPRSRRSFRTGVVSFLKRAAFSLLSRKKASWRRRPRVVDEDEDMELLNRDFAPSLVNYDLVAPYPAMPELFLTPSQREAILEKKRIVSQEKVQMVLGEVEAADHVKAYGFAWLDWMEYKRRVRVLDCVKHLKCLAWRNACRMAEMHMVMDDDADVDVNMDVDVNAGMDVDE